jgi:tRNA(His) guanylyltransferase
MGALADRIKRYEEASKFRLQPRQPLFIRVDGRAFHTYTKGMDRPFDHDFMSAMVYAATEVARDMMGFKLAYVQSDEATFMLGDYDTYTTQGWFDYELAKVVSISASLMTAHFNNHATARDHSSEVAIFDSRAFTVPESDAPNVFIWRQQDWERNSLTMLAQAHFSHKQLHGKKSQDMHDMLHEIGVNWAHDLVDQAKNGTFIVRDVMKFPLDPMNVWSESVTRTVFVNHHLKAPYNLINKWILGDPDALASPGDFLSPWPQ